MKKWKCSVCGYVHVGEEPPENCPVCGAPKSAFVLLEETPPEPATAAKADEGEVKPAEESAPAPAPADAAATETAKDEPAPEPAPVNAAATETAQEAPAGDETPYQAFTRLLTKLHGHPISVHIPNGVLPLSVLFVFLAAITGSRSLGTAAMWNLVFVALAMPLVIYTGYVDWQNRFNGYLTKVFSTKMACAGTVTLITPILAIWLVFLAGGDPRRVRRKAGLSRFMPDCPGRRRHRRVHGRKAGVQQIGMLLEFGRLKQRAAFGCKK